MSFKNLFYRYLTYIQRRCLRALEASTVGVRAIVVKGEDEVILVRHTYQDGWSFPGGGVGFNETAQKAIRRELHEEAGILVQGKMELFGLYHHEVRGVNDYPALFIVRDFEQIPSKSPEIAEAKWFKFSELPPGTTSSTTARMKEFLGKSEISERW